MFSGQVWFDFSDRAVWNFYRFVRALASSGHGVNLEWTPLPNGAERHAMEVFLGLSDPQSRGKFLHAMLGLVHLEGRDPADQDTLAKAIAASSAEPQSVADKLLDELSAKAAALGVTQVPSLYRHGPVVAVSLNDAALDGDLEARANTIGAMLDDDGIWELRKP